MTLGATTGSLEFRVTVTAPSGATKVIATSGNTVYAVPDTVSVATIAGGDTYALVASYATATQFTFSHSVAAINSALGAFASGATTSALVALATTPTITATVGTTLAASKVLGATVTATTAATTFTFTFVSTRTTASVTVAASAIYSFPASATCAVVSGGASGALQGGVSLGAWTDGELNGEIHAARIGPRQFAHVLTDLTIAVHPRAQGKGVGSQLFHALFGAAARFNPPVTRVELMARSRNGGAIRLYQRLGFRIEGRFTNRVRLPDGRIEDDIAMAIDLLPCV
jgi:putative acetyltransferase